jgi:hypothetical protein
MTITHWCACGKPANWHIRRSDEYKVATQEIVVGGSVSTCDEHLVRDLRLITNNDYGTVSIRAENISTDGMERDLI